MNLLNIKKISDEKGIKIRFLALKIDKSEQNLHRCIRENKISANDLEKIAKTLEVPITYFFDEVGTEDEKNINAGGNVNIGKNNSNNNTYADCGKYIQEIEYLKKEIKLKDKIIEMLEK